MSYGTEIRPLVLSMWNAKSHLYMYNGANWKIPLLLLSLSLLLLCLKHSSFKKTYLYRTVAKVSPLVHKMIYTQLWFHWIRIKATSGNQNVQNDLDNYWGSCSLTGMCYLPLKIWRVNKNRDRNNCPINWNCKVENVVYQCDVSATEKWKYYVYTGLAEGY